MHNPWNDIELTDYENHMSLDSVMQLQAMNEMMYDQFYRYDISSVMILGVAGGNGLNHISEDKFDKVYGLDINSNYLAECENRYPSLKNIFQPINADLTSDSLMLPYSDLIIANLLIEYIGYNNFQKTIQLASPRYVSCIIQINTDEGFVSDSPYLHVFDGLSTIHNQMSEQGLTNALKEINYYCCFTGETALPNGKKFVRLDYSKLP